LNSASKSNDDKINFYNQQQQSREHTENSVGTAQVQFEKNTKQTSDERMNDDDEDQIENEVEDDPRSRNILNGGK
jgi:hypothetical protein